MSNTPLWLQWCSIAAACIGGIVGFFKGRRMKRPTYRETILANKPVAFYPLDETR